MFYLITFFVLIAILNMFRTKQVINYLRNVWLANKMPGPAAIFPVGNVMLLKKSTVLSDDFANACKRYGLIGRIWISIWPIIVLCEPDDIQLVLSSKSHTQKMFLYDFLHNFLGKGLVTISKDVWHSHRKLMQPYFHLSILKSVVPIFFKCSEKCVESFSRSGSDLIDITRFVNQTVLNVLYETILGLPFEENNLNFVNSSPFREGKLQVCQRVLRPWLLLQSIYNFTKSAKDELHQKEKLEEFIRKVISRKACRTHTSPSDTIMLLSIDTHTISCSIFVMSDGEVINAKQNNIVHIDREKCMLDHLLTISKEHPRFTEQDVIDETCTLMLAGQDSVGSAIAFTLFYLAKYPEHQEKCYQEIMKINANCIPTMNDIQEMRHVGMCIKETLRLHPSVVMFGRKLGEDIRVKSGQTIHAGCDVFIIPYALHRAESLYPNANEFNPERFNVENSKSRHKYAYIPFSAGPRNCIGHEFAMIEMKIIISSVLRNFKLYSTLERSVLNPVFRVTVRAKGGVWLKLEKRIEETCK